MADAVASTESLAVARPRRAPAAQGAEPAAGLAEVYQAHFYALSAYSASLVGDRETGAEIAQEAFVRLLSRWRGVHDPRTFLFFVATNMATDHWRRQQRKHVLLQRLDTRAAHDDEYAGADVRDVVHSLPHPLRQVVILHYYADLPLAEIALLVHRPIGTVKRRLHDARGLLKQRLEA